MTDQGTNKLQLIKSVFKSREDVFAIRWEKGSKSGYIPAYSFDPYLFRQHKMKGGTFQNFADKSFLKLSDYEIEKHLNGEQQIGIYPLLQDNTSHFIAADFDGENWVKECRIFFNACKEKSIPCYLERSRSGNGGHVWIFFDHAYPANRSRMIFKTILEQSGAFSIFDKNSSFDRLFPNQDFLSGKGLGNLIALPLFEKAMVNGNSCFIDPETLLPFSNQFDFLKRIEYVGLSKLDCLFQEFESSNNKIIHVDPGSGLTITLSNVVKVYKSGLTIELVNFLKEHLNFSSSEFIIKNKIGANTYGTNRFFKLITETESELLIPKGFVGKLIRHCTENNINFKFSDNRRKLKEVYFNFNTQLRDNQIPILAATEKKDIGVIVAPPGSGKTVVALKIIKEKQQPALIIVHRKQLLEQWIERIEAFLGIPKNEIGKVSDGKLKVGEKITIATIQSLTKQIESENESKITTSFGIVIVDECHHIPATSFSNVISKLESYYTYGLTATPFRKYNDGKLIFIHLGEIIAEIKPIENRKSPKVIVRNTSLEVPFDIKTDKFETLSKILIHDSTRNKQILEDVFKELQNNNRVVIISERREHIDSLHQFLKQKFEVISLSGEDSNSSRNGKWKQIKTGNYQVLITTGQFFGEGTDIQNVNCLFLVYPFSFEGKLIQYIGRVQRSEVVPTIYDYRDNKIEYLNKLFLKRNTYYRKIERHTTLFDEPFDLPIQAGKTIVIEREIMVPIENLEFGYGTISFKWHSVESKSDLTFEMEHLGIRPEFEVLKAYFSKALGIKKFKVNIYAEYEDEKLIAQLATSKDIERINNEIIESVKFSFVKKNILNKIPGIEENLLTIEQLQKSDVPGLYNSGEELLNELLQNEKYKHYRQLQYLAEHHERQILKIRFVLSPFSFVFLLSGNENYHLILETLDTEEATYIWSIAKNNSLIKDKLREIDKQLEIIRNNGRQVFLETNPENFSKVMHDYSDDRKGFILWKSVLEERIT